MTRRDRSCHFLDCGGYAFMATSAAFPPTDANASSSLQYAQALRAEAEPLSGPGAQPADVQRAVALYQQALD